MFNRLHPLKLWTSSYPVHISEIGTRTHQIDDIMHDGFQPQKCHRSIYELANVTVYKNQLLSISSDGTLVNILGAKAERRNTVNFFGPADTYRILNAPDVSSGTTPAFVFLPHNPKKENYWHCLVDNMSQLIFMLERQRNIDVFHPADLSSMMLGYIKFLQQIYGFNARTIPDTGCRFSGLVLTTEPSLFGEFSHSRIQARRMFELAEQQLNEMGGRDLTASFKFGDIAHLYTFIDKTGVSKTIKSYSCPFSTPYRKSTFNALSSLRNQVTKNGIKAGKVVYIQRRGRRHRNPDNEHQLIKALQQDLNADVVDSAALTFAEQIELSSECEIFIGMHGAAFANMAFMNPSSHAVEIVPPSYSFPATTMFEVAAQLIGVKHKCINCALDSNRPSEKFQVDVDEVMHLIASLVSQKE